MSTTPAPTPPRQRQRNEIAHDLAELSLAQHVAAKLTGDVLLYCLGSMRRSGITGMHTDWFSNAAEEGRDAAFEADESYLWQFTFEVCAPQPLDIYQTDAFVEAFFTQLL